MESVDLLLNFRLWSVLQGQRALFREYRCSLRWILIGAARVERVDSPLNSDYGRFLIGGAFGFCIIGTVRVVGVTRTE